MSDLLYEKQGEIARITFNRPQRRNAFTAETFVLLADAWEDFRQDPQLRVAILSGSGDQAFSAGGDLKELIPLFTGARKPQSELEKRFMADLGAISDRALLKNYPLYKPVIAAVNGLAMGGGCEILQVTDLRIAVEEAVFSLPEVCHALTPGGGSTVRLARQIPYAQAMELLLTGSPISAAQALQMGLINRVVPRGQLQAEVEKFATRLTENGPLAVQAVKETVLRSSGRSLEEGFAIEAEC